LTHYYHTSFTGSFHILDVCVFEPICFGNVVHECFTFKQFCFILELDCLISKQEFKKKLLVVLQACHLYFTLQSFLETVLYSICRFYCNMYRCMWQFAFLLKARNMH